MRKITALMGLAAAALGMTGIVAAPAIEEPRQPTPPRGRGKSRLFRSAPAVGRGSIAQGNRHIRNIRTGEYAPHHHVRERARRLFRPGPERRAFIARETARHA